MRLGLNLGYSGSSMGMDLTLVQEADRLGFHSVWSAEAYGSDAVTPLTWVAARTERIRVGTAIMQLAGRTPVLTATTALTLDQLPAGASSWAWASRGRRWWKAGMAFPSGSRWGARARYVEIVRSVWRRERPVEFKGEFYQIPYRGADATGLEAAQVHFSTAAPTSPSYLAAIGPKNVAPAAEIADGLLPIFFSAQRMKVFREYLDAGFRAAGGGSRWRPSTWRPRWPSCRATTSIAAAPRSSRDWRCTWAAWGRGKNFYNDLVSRYEHEGEARRIQDLYLAGKKEDAAAAVPGRPRGRDRAVRPRRAHPRAAREPGRRRASPPLICGAKSPEALRPDGGSWRSERPGEAGRGAGSQPPSPSGTRAPA